MEVKIWQEYPLTRKSGESKRTRVTSQLTVVFWHYSLTPAAEDADGISALKLGSAVQSITSGFGAIPEPRNVTVTPSAAAVTGTTVKVYGIDFNGDAIDESFTTAGTSAKVGAKAFAAVTKIDLPIQGSTPAKQKATITVSAAASERRNECLRSPLPRLAQLILLNCVYAAADSTETLAAVKLRAALNNDTKFKAKWLAAGSGADITIESLTYAAQDDTYQSCSYNCWGV